MKLFWILVVLLSVTAHGKCGKKNDKKNGKRGILDGIVSALESTNSISSASQNSASSGNEINQNQNNVANTYGQNYQSGNSEHNYQNNNAGQNYQNGNIGLSYPNANTNYESGNRGYQDSYQNINKEQTDQQDLSRQTYNAVTPRIQTQLSQTYSAPYQRLVPVGVPSAVPVSLVRSYPVQPVQLSFQRPYSVPITRPVAFAMPHVVPVQQSTPLPVPQAYALPIPLRVHQPLLLSPSQQIYQNFQPGTHGSNVESRAISQTSTAGTNALETDATKAAQQNTYGSTQSVPEQQTSFKPSTEISGNPDQYHLSNTQTNSKEQDANNNFGSDNPGGQGKLFQPTVATLIDVQKGPLPNAQLFTDFSKSLSSNIGSYQLPSSGGFFGGSYLGSPIKSGLGSNFGGSFGGHEYALGGSIFGSTLNSFGPGQGYNFGGFSGLPSNPGISLGGSSIPSFFGFGNTAGLLSNSFSGGGFSLKQ